MLLIIRLKNMNKIRTLLKNNWNNNNRGLKLKLKLRKNINKEQVRKKEN